MELRTPERQVRAVFNDSTIRVYQAFRDEIADAALDAGMLVSPFSLTRMTWIKPSFLWMMYRSGWASKAEQSRVLAIDIERSGFEWALRNASLSAGPRLGKGKPVRVQWDPERSIQMERLDHRSIQIGLQNEAVYRYVGEWIVSIAEVTELAHRLKLSRDPALLPRERPYPLPEDIEKDLCGRDR